jgi:hypothetical protein
MSLLMHYLDVILCYLILITKFLVWSHKELYATDFDFKDAYENYRERRIWNKYMLHDGLLYRANKLCVPTSSIHLLFCRKRMEVA